MKNICITSGPGFTPVMVVATGGCSMPVISTANKSHKKPVPYEYNAN